MASASSSTKFYSPLASTHAAFDRERTTQELCAQYHRNFASNNNEERYRCAKRMLGPRTPTNATAMPQPAALKANSSE